MINRFLIFLNRSISFDDLGVVQDCIARVRCQINPLVHANRLRFLTPMRAILRPSGLDSNYKFLLPPLKNNEQTFVLRLCIICLHIHSYLPAFEVWQFRIFVCFYILMPNCHLTTETVQVPCGRIHEKCKKNCTVVIYASYIIHLYKCI